MKLGIMLSGQGSTYSAIHQAILNEQIQADIVRVVSSKAHATGAVYAQRAKPPCHRGRPQRPPSPRGFEPALERRRR